MDETIDWIIDNRCSVGRFGDGEFDMVRILLEGHSTYKSRFETYSSLLGQRLYNILKEGGCPECNFYVAIPGCIFKEGTKDMVWRACEFWRYYTDNNIDFLLSILSDKTLYLNSLVSRFYIDRKDKAGARDYARKLSQIWADRDILIIEGAHTRLGAGNDLLANAKSVRRIIAPPTDAFGRYDEILSTALKFANPTDLILCALGMTATVLSYDLAKKGFQAIDIGHVDIEYEWMKMGAIKKIPIPGKFTNEVDGGNHVSVSTDHAYISQIIAEIKKH